MIVWGAEDRTTGGRDITAAPTVRMAAAAAVSVLYLACAAPVLGQAGAPLLIENDAFAEWDIRGSNTLHLEDYTVQGQNKALSPYTDEGFQPFNDTEVTFSRRVSPYEEFRGGVGGVLNYSPYRAQDEDFTLERLNLTWEKGDAETPFRAEFGDFFGFYSLRTLQRSLKGAQVDFQPHETPSGLKHSLQVMAGFSDPNYRDVDLKNDLYTGASWLMETRDFGTFSFSGVSNLRERSSEHRDLQQMVFSVAAQKGIEAAGQRLSLEGELAFFGGDVDQGTASRSGEQDKGLFVLLDGRTVAKPLTYSIRYERYGQDFQPNGAAITANQELTELRTAYRLEDGVILSARGERVTNNLERGIPLHTTLGGLTISGPMLQGLGPGTTVRLDGSIQKAENDSSTVDTRTYAGSANISTPVAPLWTANFGLRLQNFEDSRNNTDAVTREISVSGDRRIEALGLAGSVTPGLVMRRNGGTAGTVDFGPSLALSLAGGAHAFNFNYSFLGQNPTGRENTNTHNVSTTYEYTRGAHVIGAEVAYQSRLPEATFGTQSYKFGVFWRVNFARPAKAAPRPPESQGDIAGGEPEDFRIVDIPPGMTIQQAQARLGRYRISGGVARAGVTVYETPLLPAISQRQRLAVEADGNRVTRTALIIDLDDPGNATGVSRLFERLREILIGRYGNPEKTFTVGQIRPSLVADVNSGALIRTAEWRTAAGAIRLGIPRRRDQQVRIEIQLTKGFAPPRQTLWSIEPAR